MYINALGGFIPGPHPKLCLFIDYIYEYYLSNYSKYEQISRKNSKDTAQPALLFDIFWKPTNTGVWPLLNPDIIL